METSPTPRMVCPERPSGSTTFTVAILPVSDPANTQGGPRLFYCSLFGRLIAVAFAPISYEDRRGRHHRDCVSAVLAHVIRPHSRTARLRRKTVRAATSLPVEILSERFSSGRTFANSLAEGTGSRLRQSSHSERVVLDSGTERIGGCVTERQLRVSPLRSPVATSGRNDSRSWRVDSTEV